MEKTSIKIVKTLRKAGYDAFWAGGCVRDILLMREPKDYDIVTNAKPDVIEDLLEHTIPIGKEFGVILAIVNGHHFEIATFRSDSGYSDGRRPDAVTFSHPEEDAKRRDFTINGLFYDPIKKQILDFVDGKRDIKDRLIRFIGDPHERILEDHLRIVRAIRFKTTLDFQYHPETYRAIKKHAALAAKVSSERLRDEFDKIMLDDNPVEGWEDMEDTGVLGYVMPELLELKGVAQPVEFHHEGDVWDQVCAEDRNSRREMGGDAPRRRQAPNIRAERTHTLRWPSREVSRDGRGNPSSSQIPKIFHKTCMFCHRASFQYEADYRDERRNPHEMVQKTRISRLDDGIQSGYHRDGSKRLLDV